MKILFEDGVLRDSVQADYRVDATVGPYCADYMLRLIQHNSPNSTVYTNALQALDNEFCWNESENVPELYIRPFICKGEFTRVDKLTTKELRRGHNLMRMYSEIILKRERRFADVVRRTGVGRMGRTA